MMPLSCWLGGAAMVGTVLAAVTAFAVVLAFIYDLIDGGLPDGVVKTLKVFAFAILSIAALIVLCQVLLGAAKNYCEHGFFGSKGYGETGAAK